MALRTGLGLAALLAELLAAALRGREAARGALRGAVLVRGAPSAVFSLMMRTDASRYQARPRPDLASASRHPTCRPAPPSHPPTYQVRSF